MGKIRLSALRPREAPYAEEKPAVTVRKVDEEKAQRAEHVEHVEIKIAEPKGEGQLFDESKEHQFPIQSRRALMSDLPCIAATEVRKRDGKEGERLWIVVDGVVLDATQYQQKHPGGRQIIAGFGGQDCSWQWWSFHSGSIWHSIAAGMRVGRTEGVPNPYERPPAIVGLSKHGFHDWD